MFDDDTIEEVTKTARSLDVPTAALLAVAEVESGGKTLARVNGNDEPLIRFEGHYFDRLLSGEKRRNARAAKLANPKWGKVKNPRKQSDRWALLARAQRIDHVAALSSISWGLGQVMGSHWKWLGYSSVDSLVAEARGGVAGQIALMARFIRKAGLTKALRAQDWRTFARKYNGPSYAKNRYDTKMANAFKRHSRTLERRLPNATRRDRNNGELQFGARGQEVKVLQKRLTILGHILVVDGLFGLKTDRVVREFQRQKGLPVTGVVTAKDKAAIFGKTQKTANATSETVPDTNKTGKLNSGPNRFAFLTTAVRKLVLSISKALA